VYFISIAGRPPLLLTNYLNSKKCKKSTSAPWCDALPDFPTNRSLADRNFNYLPERCDQEHLRGIF